MLLYRLASYINLHEDWQDSQSQGCCQKVFQINFQTTSIKSHIWLGDLNPKTPKSSTPIGTDRGDIETFQEAKHKTHWIEKSMTASSDGRSALVVPLKYVSNPTRNAAPACSWVIWMVPLIAEPERVLKIYDACISFSLPIAHTRAREVTLK